MTMVTETPAGFDAAAEAHRIRKSRRTGRSIAVPDDPFLVAVRQRTMLEHSLVDVATLPVDRERRALLAREIVGTLPDREAETFAALLVMLGVDWQWLNAADDSAKHDAYAALYAHASQGAAQELAARSALYRGGAR